MEQGRDGPALAPSLERAELQPEPKLDPKSHPEPGAGAEPDPGVEPDLGVYPGSDLGARSELSSSFGPRPGSEPGSEWERRQRIAARRNRVDVRRR